LFRATLPMMRPVFRANMGIDRESVARSREQLRSQFDRLEQEIGPSGYLVGDAFGLADLAVASVMTAIVRPPEFAYPLPEPLPDRFAELRDSVATHPAFAWVSDIYRRHRAPSAEVV
jgi:glutathione S-transferase